MKCPSFTMASIFEAVSLFHQKSENVRRTEGWNNATFRTSRKSALPTPNSKLTTSHEVPY
jgi:hypothetical protein